MLHTFYPINLLIGTVIKILEKIKFSIEFSLFNIIYLLTNTNTKKNYKYIIRSKVLTKQFFSQIFQIKITTPLTCVSY